MQARARVRTLIIAALALGAGCRGAPRETVGQAAAPSASAGAAPDDARAWGREIGPPLDERSSARPAAGPPLSLSASDGTGLRLVSLKARAVVDDPFALTELRLTFENPEPRELEGTFSITLPPGAALSRFAMKVNERWQEGEVVEKQAARRAYEDFLHRKQDPALLEQAAGNQFSARVFPIPARGRKELILSYSQEMRGDEPYAVPLRGLPEIAELDLAAYLPGGAEPAHAFKAERHAPAADFGFRPGPRPQGALREGGLVVARVRPVGAGHPEPLSSLLVLFDTSASRALGFDAQVDALRALVADVAGREGPDAPVAVLCFDQGTELAYDGAAGGFGEAEAAAIKKRGALGASDLGAALAAAGERARARGIKRVLVIGDGVTTAGDAVGDKVGAAALGLKEAGVERLDALAVGGIRDESMLARAARAGLARDGAVLDGDAGAAEIGRRLRATTRATRVRVEGASWQYPRELAGVQAGDDVLVYAELPPGRPLEVSVDDEPLRLGEPREAEPALLERAWARAKIASLLDEQKREGAQEGLAKQIIDLSVKHRVVSPYTAFLVLEAEQDYARFGLDRRALANVLTPEGGRIASVDRSPGARGTGRPVTSGPREARDEAARDGRAPEQRPDVGPPRSMPRPIAMSPPAPPMGHSYARGSGAVVDASKFDEGPARAMAGPAVAVQGGVVGGVVGGVLAEGNAGAAAPKPATAPLDRNDPWGDAKTSRADAGPAEKKKEDSELAAAGPPAASATVAPTTAPAEPVRRQPPGEPGRTAAGEKPAFINPYTGKFREIMGHLAARRGGPALDAALAWRRLSPGDVLALVALGAAYEAAGDPDSAARAYGSLIDLYPARADLRRFAGARLEHLAEGKGLPLAIDTFQKAVEQRPDHPASHRLLAFALAKRGEHARALDALLAGLGRKYPDDRFLGVKRILREDAGLVGAAFARAEPERRAEIEARLRAAGASIERGPSLRFVLNWETDANDVDFHIYDAEGGHAFFERPALPGGGELYADVTTGYGPECFTVRKSRGARSSLYTLQAHYYSRGPMGYGMGKLEIIEHDGQGGLSFDERPFVVMVDGAFVNLGTVGRSTLERAAPVAAK